MSAKMQNSSPGQMPTYSKEFTLPKRSNEVSQVTAVIRYYAPFGDGSPDGWENPVDPPAVELDGSARNVGLVFSAWSKNRGGYAPVNYIDGQKEGGYDQHAQVYATSIVRVHDSPHKSAGRIH